MRCVCTINVRVPHTSLQYVAYVLTAFFLFSLMLSLRASSNKRSLSLYTFLFYIHLFHVSSHFCFFCLARCSFRLFPNFRWDALWGIYSDVTLPYLTLCAYVCMCVCKYVCMCKFVVVSPCCCCLCVYVLMYVCACVYHTQACDLVLTSKPLQTTHVCARLYKPHMYKPHMYKPLMFVHAYTNHTCTNHTCTNQTCTNHTCKNYMYKPRLYKPHMYKPHMFVHARTKHNHTWRQSAEWATSKLGVCIPRIFLLGEISALTV